MSLPPAGPAFRTTRRILGHVVRLRTNSRTVIDVADAAFAAWPRTSHAPTVYLRFDVRTDPPTAPAEPLRYLLPRRDRLIIAGPGVRLLADAERGRARAQLAHEPPDPDDFRYGVLEAATLFLLTLRDRVPFHAAAVARAGTAVLVAGPSGSGKSTFAWAAARSGWSLLSEDCVYIQSRPATRIWGWPGHVHLSADGATFFEELAGREPTVRTNGKCKIAMATSATARHVRSAPRAILCLLDRSSGRPRVEPVDRADAVHALTARLEPGFDRFADVLPRALLRAVAPTAWRLDPGSDPARIPAVLERLIEATALAR